MTFQGCRFCPSEGYLYLDPPKPSVALFVCENVFQEQNLQRRVPIVDSRYDVEIQFQLGVDVFEGKFTMVVGRKGS